MITALSWIPKWASRAMPNDAESSSKEEIKELMIQIQNDTLKKSDMGENEEMNVGMKQMKSEDWNETKEKEVEESEDANESKEKEEEEKEIEECPLCKYIKGGVCKESFVAIQKCVDESKEEEKDTKCKEVRKIFTTCMFDNPVYYEPVIPLHARKVASMMISELQAEKEAVLAGDAAAIAKALSKLQPEEQPVLPAEVAAIAKVFQDLKEIAKGNESDHQPQR